MSRKKRILLNSEFELLSSGYSKYGRNIMEKFYESEKYELATLATYVGPNDPNLAKIPYRIYPNGPSSQEELDEYNGKVINQFGDFRFNEVCLHFKPDIVMSFLDTWMWQHLLESPFRPFYNLAILSAIDSAPQNEDWISMFGEVDGLFTYSEWAKSLVKEQCKSQVNLVGCAPLCANLNNFKPTPQKKKHKLNFGIAENVNIVGFVSRNQPRKLFPDLLIAFRSFLDYCIKNNNPELGKNTYLLLHTSYPDNGWDIPGLLKENGLSGKTLFTYVCIKCGLVFPTFWSGARTVCPKCNNHEAGLTNTQRGISEEGLNAIYNLMDVGIQYANSEGFGAFQVEAAACGIPIMSVDYSAMSSIVRTLKGVPLNVLAYSRESATQCFRAIPDNNHLVEQLYKHLTLPESIRLKKSFEIRKLCEKHFNYDIAAKIWMDYFDSVETRPEEKTWNSPPRFHNQVREYAPGMTNSQLVDWAIINVLGCPEKLNSFFATKLVRDLNYGAKLEGFGGQYITDNSFLGMLQKWKEYKPDQMLTELFNIRESINMWERRRVGLEPFRIPPIKPEIY